jgi:2-polyprenyl-6-methoxyphenol hydroxylase-like FAD-dependent oxidoreductase
VGLILECTHPDQIIKNDIIDVPPIRQYAFDQIVLLGDAAHATTPNLGQGACMAIEDAVVLANCVNAESTIEHAFKRYQDKRIERTTKIVKTSYTLGKVGQWKNPFLVKVRNLAMKMTPESVADKQLEFLFSVSLS